MNNSNFLDDASQICHRALFGPRYVTLNGDPAHVKWYQGIHESASFKALAALALGTAGWYAAQGHPINVVSALMLSTAFGGGVMILAGRLVNDWIDFHSRKPDHCVIDKKPGPLTEAKHLDYARTRRNRAALLLFGTLAINVVRHVHDPLGLLFISPLYVHYAACCLRYAMVCRGKWAIVDRPKQEQLERVNNMSTRSATVRGAKPALGFAP